MNRHQDSWTIPASLTLAIKHRDLERQQASVLVEIIADLHLDDPLPQLTATGSTPAGDEARLRGIPMLGARGIGGVVKGTRPGCNDHRLVHPAEGRRQR